MAVYAKAHLLSKGAENENAENEDAENESESTYSKRGPENDKEEDATKWSSIPAAEKKITEHLVSHHLNSGISSVADWVRVVSTEARA